MVGSLLHFDYGIYIVINYVPYVMNVDDTMHVTYTQSPGTEMT